MWEPPLSMACGPRRRQRLGGPRVTGLTLKESQKKKREGSAPCQMVGRTGNYPLAWIGFEGLKEDNQHIHFGGPTLEKTRPQLRDEKTRRHERSEPKEAGHRLGFVKLAPGAWWRLVARFRPQKSWLELGPRQKLCVCLVSGKQREPQESNTLERGSNSGEEKRNPEPACFPQLAEVSQ